MHPLIRVVALIVFCASMALAKPVLLVAGAGLLLLSYILCEHPAPVTLLQMIKRLRWLLLAIILVYGWWTPGIDVFPGLGAWSPTIAGLAAGMLRVAALVTIVAAVHLLLQVTTRDELLPAIMQLIKPVSTRIGRERLAVRILLSFEAVTRVQSLIAESLGKQPAGYPGMNHLGRVSRGLYKAVLDEATVAGKTIIDVVELAAPPLWQWLIPIAICVGTYIGY